MRIIEIITDQVYDTATVFWFSSYIFVQYNSYTKDINFIDMSYHIIGTLYINCEEEVLIIPFTTVFLKGKYYKGFDLNNFEKWTKRIGDYQPSLYDIELLKV